MRQFHAVGLLFFLFFFLDSASVSLMFDNPDDWRLNIQWH